MATAAQDFITEAKAGIKINAYEVFCTSFSQIVYAASLRDAVKIFEENNPKEYAIMAQNTEYSRIEREKGEREAEENALLYSHYCHICGDHDGKHNEDCTAYVPGITPNP